MEIQANNSGITDKELALKKMALSQKQDKVLKIALSNGEARKQLWDKWKAKHPESRKTWRTNKTQSSRTLRCQAPLIIKKISTTVSIAPADQMEYPVQDQASSMEEEPIEPAALERSDSIRSDISGIETQISPNEARRMQEEVQNMREESESTFILDPLFNSPSPQNDGNQESSEDTDRAREVEISEIYIDEESQIEWSKNNLTANTFQTEPFPVRALSETNRYELKNFYKSYLKKCLR